MVKKILLLGLLAAGLYANEMETVDVKVCIDTTKNADKSFNQMKEMLVSKAQDEGYNSLYKKALGEENKNALTDHHRKDLSVKVNDMSDEGNNFCNNSTISIKKERLQYYLPQKVSKDRICHKDGNLSPAKLKEAAALKGYKALISEITDKEISDELAKKLVHNYQRDDGKMYMAQGAYCFGASGEVVPFEVDMGTVSQASQTGNTNIKIIKNKGYAKVYFRDGKSSEFDVDFNGNGFIINPKDYTYIQTLLKNKVAVHGTITTQLMIPNEIKTNTVNIKINGSPTESIGGDAWYHTFINGQKNQSELLDIPVKHNNGLRYIELTIELNAKGNGYGARQFPKIVKKLEKLSYSIDGVQATSFIFDKSSFQKGYAKVYFRDGKSSEFDVDFNGNGFIINPKDYTYIQTLLKNKVAVHGTITTQLMIPNEIKTNTVNVKINGRTTESIGGDAWYHTFINGQKNQSELLDIPVKHNNGLRYIELTIELNAKGNGYGANNFPDIAKYLSNISYMATDTENGEKWYALNSKLMEEEKNAQFEFNGKKSSVSFNGNGFIINKKDYKKIQTLLTNKVAVQGTITTQLMIPNEIKTNTVNVKINGRTKESIGGDAWYHTFINGQKDQLELLGIAVKQNNGLRYIELTIELNAKGNGYGANNFPDIAKYLSNISYMATDTENGEKWYGLKPAK